jgi:DNA polymerase/3'-5' exonuclease PolX
VRELCAKYGIRDRMPRYIPDGTLATNKRVAEEILTKCYLLELESAPSFKVWAYRQAGWTVDELDQDILAIYKKRGLNGLQALPNIGSSIAAFIAERLDET